MILLYTSAVNCSSVLEGAYNYVVINNPFLIWPTKNYEAAVIPMGATQGKTF